jgi:hypothetical protein
VLEKLDISRIGNVIDLDSYRIDEVLSNESSTFISPMFYNKGVYRVMNNHDNQLEDFAINIDKIEAATYNGLVEEFGTECVDPHLWDDVPEGSIIFFYSFKLEKNLVLQHSRKKNELIKA